MLSFRLHVDAHTPEIAAQVGFQSDSANEAVNEQESVKNTLPLSSFSKGYLIPASTSEAFLQDRCHLRTKKPLRAKIMSLNQYNRGRLMAQGQAQLTYQHKGTDPSARNNTRGFVEWLLKATNKSQDGEENLSPGNPERKVEDCGDNSSSRSCDSDEASDSEDEDGGKTSQTSGKSFKQRHLQRHTDFSNKDDAEKQQHQLTGDWAWALHKVRDKASQRIKASREGRYGKIRLIIRRHGKVESDIDAEMGCYGERAANNPSLNIRWFPLLRHAILNTASSTKIRAMPYVIQSLSERLIYKQPPFYGDFSGGPARTMIGNLNLEACIADNAWGDDETEDVDAEEEEGEKSLDDEGELYIHESCGTPARGTTAH